MLPIGCLASLTVAILSAPPAVRLEITPAETIEAVLTFDIECPNLTAREWILYAPRLPELPGQTRVSSTILGLKSTAEDLSPGRRPLLFTRVVNPKQEHTLTVPIKYQATLQARKLVPRTDDVRGVPPPALPPAARKLFLADGPTMDFTAPAFQKWLAEHDLKRRADESEIDLARRVFLAIRRNFTYVYRPDLDRRGSAVCTAGQSDCGGLAILFVGALRANDVPARMLIGRHARSAEKGQKLSGFEYFQAHVKTEFFADGVGWVPADPSAKLGKDRSKNSDGLEFFGADKGDFLTQHVDMDLTIDSLAFGRKAVPVLQSVAWWVKGQGSLEGQTVKEDWQVKVVP